MEGTTQSDEVDGAGASRPLLPSRRFVLGWLFISTAIWGANAGWLIYSAQADVRASESALRSVADIGDPSEVDLEATAAALIDGRADLDQALDSLTSPILSPLRPVPVVGRQLESAEALLTVTNDLLSEVEPLLSSALAVRENPNDVDRVAFLREVADRLGAVDTIVAEAELGPSTGLVPALAEGRVELQTRMLDLQAQARRYETVALGMAEFLDSSNYLVVGANNAEMRLGSGMFLSIGSLSMSDGEFDLPGLTPASEFEGIVGADIVDPDMARMWNFTSLRSDFRGIGYSARFDDYLGPQALELWEASEGEQLDGVVMLDPFVLDALLGVIGEVDVEGRVFRQGETLEFLLRGQYSAFTTDQRDERQDLLSLLASAVVDELGSSPWDPLELLRELEPVANSRHIMAYSIDPAQQAAWQAMGVDGSLSGQETGVFLLNHGASKLDSAIELSVVADTEDVDGATVVTYEVSVANNAAADLPEYVIGPWESIDLPEAGTHLGRLAVYAPGGATDIGFIRGPRVAATGSDGPVEVVASELIEFLPQTVETFVFQYTLPAGTAVDLMPSGRFPAAVWSWNDESFTDANPRPLIVTE